MRAGMDVLVTSSCSCSRAALRSLKPHRQGSLHIVPASSVFPEHVHGLPIAGIRSQDRVFVCVAPAQGQVSDLVSLVLALPSPASTRPISCLLPSETKPSSAASGSISCADLLRCRCQPRLRLRPVPSPVAIHVQFRQVNQSLRQNILTGFLF
jgi:hypothetical protein